MSNWHSASLGITSTTTFHILHQHTATFPMHHTIPHQSHHNISHLTLHDITASHHWCRTYSTLHLTSPHHSHRVNKRYSIPHLALQNVVSVSHQIWHDAVWPGGIEIREMWCDVEWCAVPEMWFDVDTLSCGGEMLNVSVTHCHCGISHLVTSSHHILHCIIWPFHVTPSFLAISPISYHTSTSRSTLFHFAIPYLKSHHWYRPHYASRHVSLALHPILHYVPHNATFHVLHATFKITPYIGHIMHHTTTSHHHTTFYTTDIVAAPHSASASFHHIISLITPTPHPTTMFQHSTSHISTPPYYTSDH